MKAASRETLIQAEAGTVWRNNSKFQIEGEGGRAKELISGSLKQLEPQWLFYRFLTDNLRNSRDSTAQVFTSENASFTLQADLTQHFPTRKPCLHFILCIHAQLSL